MSAIGFYGAVRHAQRSDWGRVVLDAAAKRSAVEVVLDDWRLAPALAQQDPRRIVVIRNSFDEKASDHHPDGAAWFREVYNAGYHPSAYLEIENEPSVPGEDAEGRAIWLDWHAGWLLDAMYEAERHNARLCVGNWSTGTPLPEDWAQHYAAVLRRVVEGGHLLGIHCYYAKSPDHPISLAMMGTVAAAIQTEPGLFGRVVLTETGSDRVWQVPDSVPGWRLAETWQLHRDRMLNWFERWRNVGVYGAAEFLWIERLDENQDRWKYFNIAGQNRYNEALAAFDYGEWLTMPIDMTKTEAGTVAPKSVPVNIRATANGTDIGDLEGPRHSKRTVEAEPAGDYEWRYYWFDTPTANTPNGWIANVVNWAADPIVEPPPVEPPPVEPPPDTPAENTLTHAQALALMQAFADMFTAQREAWLAFEDHVGVVIDAQVAALDNAIGLCQETITALEADGEPLAA